MSIYRFDAYEYGPYDSRYIQCFDLVFQNIAQRHFDVLIQGYQGQNRFLLGLYHLDPAPQRGSIAHLPTVYNHNQPFTLHIHTNLTNPYPLAMTMYAKNEGALVATFTTNELTLVDSL
ncbi:hypothetical protein [Paenibacillus sp. UNC499MF]|uniref:hypothetical protein n=1 Tax=Paenibacillus sp. UNC499MF TaxID=1502751 RepID=UPI0008A01B8F|nr:hypothetical protein [Paenibacillus sp. UNC499MF]SEG36429.1 hypothetical protein SAMN02799616_02666 [Paenibacillus sp. UNC499MF]